MAVAGVVACMGAQVTTHQLELLGEAGSVTVTVVDRAGVVREATGVFDDHAPDWREGLHLVRGDLVQLRWSGSCSEEASISIEAAADDRLRIGLRTGPGGNVAACAPRGLVNHSVTLDLGRAFAPNELLLVDERRGG